MGLLDSITVAIAGPTAVKQSQERILERRYSHIAESLKSVTDSLPEPPFQALPVRKTPSSNPTSLRSYRTESDSLLLTRPLLQRSHSEVPNSIDPHKQQQFPPDITTLELTAEQLRRAYSHNNVWDVKDGFMPPLPEMKGFGKYRAAINANKRWHIEKVKRSMSDLDSLVKDLDNLSPGLSNEEWEQCKQEQLTRRGSAITSQSTRSNSSYGADFVVDGTRISHGFSPSTMSSANSSFKDSRANFRKDSNLSVTSTGSENRHTLGSRTPHHSSTQGNENDLPRIVSLRRMQSAMRASGRKIEQPCEFGTGGDPESALASDASDIDDDDDDDNEEESEWADVIEFPRCQDSSLSKMLREINQNETQKPITRTRTTSEDLQQRRASRNGIDRSKTVRAVSRKRFRRYTPRMGGLQTQDIGSEGPDDEVSSQQDIFPEVIGEIEDLSTAELPLALCKIKQENGDVTLPTDFHDKTTGQNCIVSATSTQFDSTDQMPALRVTQEGQPLRRRRNRSSTAVRINPSGLPLLKPAQDHRD